MNTKLLKERHSCSFQVFCVSFKTLSLLFMGDDNVLNINSPSNIQRLWQHSAVSEPEQTHAYRGYPKCYYTLGRFKLETFYVDRCQAIFGCHMISTYIQAKQKIQSIIEMFCLFDAKNSDIWKQLDN